MLSPISPAINHELRLIPNREVEEVSRINPIDQPTLNTTQPSYDLHTVFSNEHLKSEFVKFINNIFLRLDEKKFLSLIERQLGSNEKKSDQEIYQALCDQLGSATHGAVQTIFLGLKALKGQQNALASQVKRMMGDTPVDGMIEIGMPARMVRPIRKAIELTGSTIVVNEQESIADYIQSGFPRPYDQFVPLNNYQAIDKGQVKSDSVDLVTCFPGLHHVEEDQLDPFIQSIHRVLRVGGSFILRDHHADSDSMEALVGAVHTVFNAFDQIPLEENFNEIRRFLPLETWIKKLEAHGFELASDPDAFVRAGDPTANTLLRFVKKDQNPELTQIRNELKTVPDYFRPLEQTYLTSPEWLNVDIFREYADSLQNGSQWFDFPYFRQIASFWGVFQQSYQAARKQHSFTDIVSSEYMRMNLFIGITMTMEFLAKGVTSIPFALYQGLTGSRPGPNGDQTHVERYIADMMDQYAQFIEHTPFYQFNYFSRIPGLWNAFLSSRSERCFLDLLTAIATTIELLAKGVIALPVGGWKTQPGNRPAQTIQMLIQDQDNVIESSSDPDLGEMKVNKTHTIDGVVYKQITVPRYRKFAPALEELVAKGGVPVEISGQEIIQVKLCVATDDQHLETVKQDVSVLEGCRSLYHYPIITDPDHCYLQVEVDVDQLGKVLPELRAKGDIAYIHDF